MLVRRYRGPGWRNEEPDRAAPIDVPTSTGGSEPDKPVPAPTPFRSAREAKLVVDPETSPMAIEQYRRLAAVMHQAQVARNIKIVMVTSALAGEGKTLTSTNLALTLSESYRRRVLLVDADLRRPMLHELFRLPNLAGLSDGLKAHAGQKMPLVEITSQLTLLPGGRPDPDPMSSLTSERMQQMIRQAAERFDWVVLDTPPIGILPDGHLVASMVDTVVLVVAAGRTPVAAIQRVISALGPQRIAGVVLNRVDDPTPVGYSSRYHGSSSLPARPIENQE